MKGGSETVRTIFFWGSTAMGRRREEENKYKEGNAGHEKELRRLRSRA